MVRIIQARLSFVNVAELRVGCMLDFNPIPTRLCHMIYCQGDKSYPYLVGIGLSQFVTFMYFTKKYCITNLDQENNFEKLKIKKPQMIVKRSFMSQF